MLGVIHHGSPSADVTVSNFTLIHTVDVEVKFLRGLTVFHIHDLIVTFFEHVDGTGVISVPILSKKKKRNRVLYDDVLCFHRQNLLNQLPQFMNCSKDPLALPNIVLFLDMILYLF